MMKLNGRVVVTGKMRTRKAEKQVSVLLIVVFGKLALIVLVVGSSSNNRSSCLPAALPKQN